MKLFLVATCAIQVWGAPTTTAPTSDPKAESVVSDTTTHSSVKNSSDVDQKIFPFDNQGFGLPFGGAGFPGAQNPFGNVFGGNPYGYSPFQTPYQNSPYGQFPQRYQNQYPNLGQYPSQGQFPNQGQYSNQGQSPGYGQFNPSSQGQVPVNQFQPSAPPVQPAQVLGQPGSGISTTASQDGQNPSGSENSQPPQVGAPNTPEDQGQNPQGVPGPSFPQGQPTQGPQNQLPPGAQGQFPQGSRGQLPQGAQGELPPGAQGQLPPGAQGQFPVGVQSQLPQNPQGFQTGYPGNPQAPPFPPGRFDQASQGGLPSQGQPQNTNGATQPGQFGPSGPGLANNLGSATGQPGFPTQSGAPGQGPTQALPSGQFPPGQLPGQFNGQGPQGSGQGPQGVPINQGPQGSYNGQGAFQGQPQGQFAAPGQFQQGFPQGQFPYPVQFQNPQGLYPSQYYAPEEAQGQFFPQGSYDQSNGQRLTRIPFPGQGGAPGQFQGSQGGQAYPGQFQQGFYPQQQYPQGFYPQQQYPQGFVPQQQYPQTQGFQPQYPQQGPQQGQQPSQSNQGQLPSPGTGLNGALPLPTGQEPSSGTGTTQSRFVSPASSGLPRSSSSGGPPNPERASQADQPLPQASQGNELRSEVGAVRLSGQPEQSKQSDASTEDSSRPANRRPDP